MNISGGIWVAFWLRMPKEPRVKLAEESSALARAEKEEARESIPWRKLLTYRQAWSLIIVRFLTDPIWWFFLFWLPDFFNKHFGYNIKESALPLIVIYALVTVLSIIGGSLTKYLAGLGWSLNKVRKISMLIFACCVLPVIFVQYFDMWTIVAVLGLAGGGPPACIPWGPTCSPSRTWRPSPAFPAWPGRSAACCSRQPWALRCPTS